MYLSKRAYKNALIDDVVRDLNSLRSSIAPERIGALEDNIRFFEAIRRPRSYAAWVLFEMPNIDTSRLLELSDFDIPRWQALLQAELMEIEQWDRPDILAQLRVQLISEIEELARLLHRPLVLLNVGAGAMEIERQVIKEVKRKNDQTSIVFVVFDNAQASLDAGFKNLKDSGVVCMQENDLTPQKLKKIGDSMGPGAITVVGVLGDALSIGKVLPEKCIDLAYYSKFKHHLPNELKKPFTDMLVRISDRIVEGDDYRGFYLPFFSTLTAWYKPILLNGAIFSSLRDPSKKELRSFKEKGWRVVIRPGGGYVKIYHAEQAR